MTFSVWASIALIVFPLSYLVWTLFSTDRAAAMAIKANLSNGIGGPDGQSQAPTPVLIDIVRKATPTAYIARLDGLLAFAGRPRSMPLDKVLAIKPTLGLAGAALGLLLYSNNAGAQMVLLGLFITALFYFMPDLLIYNSAVKRQQAIEQELPDTLDQMLISVEAGLGFETAMARAGQNGKGPLAEEIVRTLQDIQVGRPRREAYQSMAERSTVDDLKSFVRAVVQADKYGIGISTVLKTQAKQSRVKRRQRAEEKAMKLPVKTLFPLILFIFPVMFIVMLGPAAINIMRTFG
ncbi:type II secretion system F family protein [Arthrobacter crusticola]|uniref:Type II secretion system F family protein n=1 Tax=Arthrobacter crusticola TaxID=2547960 RepID=A0A4R5TX18_9MICC|nr:type II secretion system F family protein [Arthrobacter crusticola]TDK25715.1 type II secretion system F family protein [Arthrobacter crusticola]